jgi:hypothetical protein
VSNLLRRIVEFTTERQELYAVASHRWLTLAEQLRLAELTAALAIAWEQRRVELARRPPDRIYKGA